MIWNSISYFISRKVIPGYKLKKKDIVIDIGSGDKPFWRGNVFLDNLSLGNLHRHTDTATIRTFGTLVDSDITKTNFKNKAFDFSFCAHLLEHVERPDLAIREITRISKKGYIELPNGVIEFISPFHSHLWFIFLSKKKLIFVRKTDKLHKILKENSEKYYFLVNKNSEPFIRFYWKGDIECEIIDNNKESEKYYPPKTTPKTRNNPAILAFSNIFYIQIVRLLRFINGVNENVDIKPLLKK